ncbi:MAG: hypothetical protein ICV84_07825 [Flavisolibacter sp.]|nr:hypothetical protein [Flavisolibacter sp.]
MKIAFQHLLPEHFSPKSRVWIYQSNRLFSLGEALQIEEILADFLDQWHAHGAKVQGYANLFFGHFIVLMADETSVAVSGCSTDSSVRSIKAIEQQFGVDLFNRNNLAFVVNDKIQLLPLSQLSYAFQNNFITADTLYFNNLVQTKEALEKEWILPVGQSWLAKRLKLQVQ